MKPATITQAGVFVAVQYPYRATPDLYIAIEGYPMFCAQCEATFPVEEFDSHVKEHDLRLRRRRMSKN